MPTHMSVSGLRVGKEIIPGVESLSSVFFENCL